MATAKACPQVVETIIQMFKDFLVSLVQQQLSEELLLVINPKSVGATLGDHSKICWLDLQEFDSRGNKLAEKTITLAQRKHVIFFKNERAGVVEVEPPLVCGWLT